MRQAVIIFGIGVLAIALAPFAVAGSDDAIVPPPITCGNGIPGGLNCILSKKDLKDARKAYSLGIKLEQQRRLEDAFEQFDQAARMVPQNVQFLQARELVKAQLVFRHVEDGNLLLARDSRPEAAAQFRAALELDPDNQFAQERLADATSNPDVDKPPVLPAKFADTGEIHLEPIADRASFHFRGDARGLYTELANSFGLKVQFDDSIQNRQVRFFVDDVDFVTALNLASRVTKTMWAALDSKQLFIASDTPDNHRQFDHLSLRTLTLPPHSTPQEVNDLITTLRNMLDIRFINSGQTADTVEVRGSPESVAGCATLLAQLSNEKPQVMLDIQIFQISRNFTRNIGMHVPQTFNLYNIPAAALAGLGGQNIQQLINQLIASGGINQAGSTALSGLLAQLGSGQSGIFSQPLATFGGGLTFSGLSLDHLSAALSVNESWARSLSSASMRATQGNDTTFHLGERYPIQNASYAPIFNSPQIAQVLGNQSYVPPFPSVSYEDLGLNIKVKPTIHRDSVSLQIELEVRSLTGASANGVPVIANQEYKGSINVKDGEPAVMAGEVSVTDTYSMTGIPGFGAVPVLNQIMANNTKEEDSSELLISIVPHIVANTFRTAPEIWVSTR
jgi:tetratricopeptide (TPR) repeat protein